MSRSIEPLFELYIFETTRSLEQLESCILGSEQIKYIDCNTINDALRIIHTIKGSAAMMLYTSISTAAHSLEELFYYLREQKKEVHNFIEIADIVFRISEFIKSELAKIEDDIEPTGNPEPFIIEVNVILNRLKTEELTNIGAYKAVKMVSGHIHGESLQEPNFNEKIKYNNSRIDNINLGSISNEIKYNDTQNMFGEVNINIKKLDKLMYLMDEMDIAQVKVIENPDINGLKLDNFNNAARQLKMISSELRELITSIRIALPVDNK